VVAADGVLVGAGPTADPDQDGFDNAWEFRTGSVPTNRVSANFEIESVRVTASGAWVKSETAKGRKFQLFTRDTIPGPSGGALVTPRFPLIATTAGTAIYRVQMIP
jgi:hypothetical protein